MKKIFFIGISILLGLMLLGIIIVAAGENLHQNTDIDKLAENAVSITLPDVEISVDEVTASGFENPVQVTHAGDGSNRIFVVEQTD